MTELRVAIRRLRKSPGFTVAVALILTLAIGGTTALFALVDGVLLRPLPFPDSDRLVTLAHEVGGVGHQQIDQSDASILLYQSQAVGFEGISGWRFDDGNLGGAGDGNTIRVRGARVTANFFDVLGVRPMMGRGFEPGEDRPGRNEVVVISDGLWRDRFGMDPGTIGKQIEVNNVPRTIVGIMPAGFRFPSGEVRIWLPLSLDPTALHPETFNLNGLGRLKEGVTIETAGASLRSTLDAPESPYRRTGSGQTDLAPRIERLHDAIVGPSSQLLSILFLSMVLVMLVACANVAGLFLIRAERMQLELAIRSALGSGASQIVALSLAEAAVLSAAGGLLGTALANVGVVYLRDAGAILALPRMDEVAVSGSVLLFAAGATAFCALFVSLFPAIRTRAVAISSLLKRAGAGTTPPRSRTRSRSGLVVAQIALAFVLIALFGLSWRSFLRLRDVELGFDAAGVVTSRILLPYARYGPLEARVAFFEEVVQRASALPGVASVGLSNWVPLDGSHRDMAVDVEDTREGFVGNASHTAAFVDSRFLRTLGIPLIRGRTFPAGDMNRPTTEVLVSRAFADRYWPGEDPIGHRIRIRGAPWYTVVGEVADAHYDGLEIPANEMIYFPPVIMTETGTSMAAPLSVVVRTDGRPSATLAAIRDIVRSIDAGVPTFDEATVSELVREAFRIARGLSRSLSRSRRS